MGKSVGQRVVDSVRLHPFFSIVLLLLLPLQVSPPPLPGRAMAPEAAQDCLQINNAPRC